MRRSLCAAAPPRWWTSPDRQGKPVARLREPVGRGGEAAGVPQVLTTADKSERATIAGEGAHYQVIGDFRDGSLAECPLGAGALSGVGFPIDRRQTARA